MRQRIAVAAGIVVSGFFLWLAFRDADLASIGASISAANKIIAVPFLICLFAFYWLKSVRWKYLLSTAGKVRSRELFPIIMIGYAGTAVLPMQMGEFVRAYIAGKRFSLPYSLVLSSIAMERIFDLLTILALLGVVLATGQSTPDTLITAGYGIAAVTLFALLAAIALVTQTTRFLTLTSRILSFLPKRATQVVLQQLEVASQGLESVTRPALLFRIVGNSLLQWGLMGFCIWGSLLALDIQVPFSGVVLVLVTTIIGISLPTSPGYIGNIQLAFVVALQPFGVGVDEAIAASVFYHVLAYLAVVIVGFTYLHKFGLGIFEIRRKAKANTVGSTTP